MLMTKKGFYGFRYYGFVLCALFLTACSGISSSVRLYDGDKKNDNEIVKFILPTALDVLELDGEKVKGLPYVPDGYYQLDVLPGKHTLKVVYSEVWGGDSLGTLEVSNAFHFTVDTTAASRYEFKHDAPEDLVYADFEKFASDIKIWIEEKNTGKRIDTISVGKYGSLITRFFLGDTAVKKQQVDSKVSQGNAIQEEAVKQLQSWWKLADTKQRKIFQIWIIKQAEIKTETDTDSLQKKAAEQLRFWWEIANEKQRKLFQAWAAKDIMDLMGGFE